MSRHSQGSSFVVLEESWRDCSLDRDEHFDGEKGEAKVDPNLVAIKVNFTEKAIAEFKQLKSLKE